MKKLFTLVCTLALGCVLGFAQTSTPASQSSSDQSQASTSSTAKTKKAKKSKKSKKKADTSTSTPEATPAPK